MDREPLQDLILDRETLRIAILDGDDKLMNSRLWNFLNAEQKRMMTAGRDFWAKSDSVTNAALDDFLALYQKTEKGAEPCESF